MNAQIDSVNYYKASGNYYRAIQLLENQMKNNPENCMNMSALAELYQAVYKPNKAIEYYQKATSICKDRIDLQGRYADILFEEDKYNKADSIYDVILERSPTNFNAINKKAKLLVKAGLYNEAIRYYLVLDSLSPSASYFKRAVASCYQKLDSIRNAYQWYRKAYDCDTTDLKSIITYSNFLHKNAWVDSALLIVNKGLSLYPINYDLKKKKANILFMQEKYHEAIPLFEEVVTHTDSSFTMMRQLGISYHMAGGYRSESIEVLTRATKLEPEDYISAFYLGLSYRQMGQTDRALEQINHAIDLLIPKQVVLYYVERGNTHLLMSNPSKTIEDYKTALWYSPDRKQILVEIGLVYEKEMNDLKSALIYYERFKREYNGADEQLVTYINDKIRKVKEELHFQTGKE
ncbi:MAG: hypothetical protein C0594_02245 [Marinilabiliales bacterium]|nr:MAG: hypothetical protein C0594_02245 [Marinilabiliales bacterium]